LLVLDETTEFGSRAARRLRDDIIGWLATVSPDGAPRPVPIWFLWGGDRSLLLYSRPGKQKLRNIAANPKVSLNLDSDGVDADIVICWGELRISDDLPANTVPEYVAKYAERIAALGWTPESFAADFSVPLRLELTRIHGW
jgi:PPOX class probable F420-dependent enzyme